MPNCLCCLGQHSATLAGVLGQGMCPKLMHIAMGLSPVQEEQISVVDGLYGQTLNKAELTMSLSPFPGDSDGRASVVCGIFHESEFDLITSIFICSSTTMIDMNLIPGIGHRLLPTL